MTDRAGVSSPRAAGDVPRAPFGATAGGEAVEVFTLRNAAGMEVRFINYGGIILSLTAPDRNGRFADVTLGYGALEPYFENPGYLGAIIGRYANRIGGARFELDGHEYDLPPNDPPNHLHGGPCGFHKVLWTVAPFQRPGEQGAVLTHVSPDGDQGYPGRLIARVTYTLTDANELAFDFHATTERATPVCLTQHAYFNLAGHDAGSILDHELELSAAAFTPVDAGCIPTGEIRPVAGTPLDFTRATRVGERIETPDEQLRNAHGYDHNFVVGEGGALARAALLRDPASGRVLEIRTTEPGIQFYSGNWLAGGPPAKHGRPYGRREGLALETQHFPDSPNKPGFPSVILRPGEELRSRTVYRFTTDRMP